MAAKKSKMGRPLLLKGTSNCIPISCRISKLDEHKFDAAIKSSGLSRSEWMRNSLLTVSRTVGEWNKIIEATLKEPIPDESAYFAWGCTRYLFGIKNENGQPKFVCDYPVFFDCQKKNQIFTRLMKLKMREVECLVEMMDEKTIKSEFALVQKKKLQTWEKITIKNK